MPLPADYHMHTVLCRHAVGVPTEYAAQAIQRGLTEIGFSEHNPMIRDDYDDWHMLQRDFDDYINKVEQARRDHPNLVIKIALEVDYIPGQEDYIRSLAARHPWDYLIGAVHYVSESWDLDNPQKISEWKHRDPFEVWTVYFERMTMAAASGLFDIMAHADLCKKFCFYPKQDYMPLVTQFLKTVKEADLAMELNTAGLRKDCREIYPSRSIVELAARHGVPITFASDAHAPGEVGMNFDDAVALARAAGYTQTCRFSGRKRQIVEL
jgi:histidinol-phosphatase (PHP family)